MDGDPSPDASNIIDNKFDEEREGRRVNREVSYASFIKERSLEEYNKEFAYRTDFMKTFASSDELPKKYAIELRNGKPCVRTEPRIKYQPGHDYDNVSERCPMTNPRTAHLFREASSAEVLHTMYQSVERKYTILLLEHGFSEKHIVMALRNTNCNVHKAWQILKEQYNIIPNH